MVEKINKQGCKLNNAGVKDLNKWGTKSSIFLFLKLNNLIPLCGKGPKN